MAEVNFDNDNGIVYQKVSWQQLGQLAIKLAGKILKTKPKPPEFDCLVALATGGLTMGRTLKDYLNIPQVASLQIKFYTQINQTASVPVIIQSVPINLDGQSVLIFDDINDTGATLQSARQYLTLRGAKQITTATLFQKSHSSYTSDYFGQMTNNWIVFPDETRETIDLLSRKWRKQGLSLPTIKQRLSQIGFTNQEIKLFIQVS
ncbi:MAG: hypothetical protein GXP43_00655 [bacterium]|nr:hypothetical protein [bacterium]